MNKFFTCIFTMLLLSNCKKTEENTTPPTLPDSRKNEISFTVGNVKYTTGFSQTSSNNQDAYVIKEENGVAKWVKYYDRSPDDSRGVALNADGSRLYVAFTCTGGNTDFKATSGSFQNSYGSGGGPKITFFARLNPDNGEVLAATFIGAKLSDGKTNTMYPDDKINQPIEILTNNQVEIQAIHAYDKGDSRLTPGSNDTDCNNSGGKWAGTFNEKMALLSGDCF